MKNFLKKLNNFRLSSLIMAALAVFGILVVIVFFAIFLSIINNGGHWVLEKIGFYDNVTTTTTTTALPSDTIVSDVSVEDTVAETETEATTEESEEVETEASDEDTEESDEAEDTEETEESEEEV